MPAPMLPFRRILVALDISPQSLAALRAAVELGVKLDAQLIGLFVEDTELLRLAASPYARELIFPAAREVALDRPNMERNLKAQAEQAREAMAAVADQANVKWSFRVVRGSVSREILAAAADCDLLVLGHKGWSLIQRGAIGSTALAAVSRPGAVLILPSGGAMESQPAVVWFDGKPTSKRGLLAAAELARLTTGNLTVLLPPPEVQSDDRLQKQVMDLLKDPEIRVRCERVRSSDEEGLLRSLRLVQPSVIVLTGNEPFCKRPGFASLLAEIEIPALFLGEESVFQNE